MASQKVPTTINRNSGFPPLQDSNVRNAEQLLLNLLAQAGLSGEFKISFLRNLKGSKASKGIHLSSHNEDSHGVSIKVQPGGNNTRIEVVAYPPEGITPENLHARLQQALLKQPHLKATEPKGRKKMATT